MKTGLIIFIVFLLLFIIITAVILIVCFLKSRSSVASSDSTKNIFSETQDQINFTHTRLEEKIYSDIKKNNKKKINININNNHHNNNIKNESLQFPGVIGNDNNRHAINVNINNNNTNNNENIKNNNDILTETDLKLINDKGYIHAKIHEETKIGLNNIGATCYMNATLQCLRNSLYLANYFLNPKNEKLITLPDNKLSISFLEVIKKLWIKKYNDDKNNYSPYNFKKTISEMNPLFEGVEANDSKDLINFILQQLHSELNLTKNNENKIINNINQYDELAMIQNFLEDFQQNNHSIISDAFFGIIETETVCLNCKERYLKNGIINPPSLYNFQFISFIIFPLEEIRKLKSSTNNINYNEINIYDCFDYYERPELLEGNNAIWCQNCQQNSSAYYMTKLYSSSYYLILILNRGKGNIYDVKLYFEEEIDIGKYVQMKSKDNLFYKLYAIVTHLGPSSMSGHFIAFCRSPIDNNWYKYNDAQVSLIGNFYKDIHEFGCPYILFYERNEK